MTGHNFWGNALSLAVVYGAVRGSFALRFAPASWPLWSVACWLVYANIRGWQRLSKWDHRHLLWGGASALAFLYFLHLDRSFAGWQDVYYFCGERLQYCTCEFKWNARGWAKAGVLWSFVLSFILGLHKLVIQLGLDGLLPGEEMVTKESFISICWRLIPYWLNNWEQQWGAECSSMMFELPHFAVELLLVLPCVQIICARLKILALPHMRVMLHNPGAVAPAAAPGGPPAAAQPLGRRGGAGGEDDGLQREHLAANVLRGFWEVDAQQRSTWVRLRANSRMMLVTVLVSALAAFNALCVPLHLERTIGTHPRTAGMLRVAAAAGVAALNTSSVAGGAGGGALPLELAGLEAVYAGKGCRRMDRLYRNVAKHAAEIGKMRDPQHAALIPLVEASLALMRLCCEKYFVLLSVYVAYLLFREPPSAPVRFMIRLNARLSSYIQKAILYSFPAVCWLYGAGIVFSSFVSVVFWGGPAARSLEALRKATTVVAPRALRDATGEQVERMGGSCAICWGEMDGGGSGGVAADAAPGGGAAAGTAAPPAAAVGAAAAVADSGAGAGENAPGGGGGGGAQAAGRAQRARRHREGKALPCGHAFHERCLVQWLHQCHGQGRMPTCPMCQAAIELEVRYRLASVWRSLWSGARRGEGNDDGGGGEGGAGAGDAPGARQGGAQGGGGLAEEVQRELQALIEDVEPVPFVPPEPEPAHLAAPAAPATPAGTGGAPAEAAAARAAGEARGGAGSGAAGAPPRAGPPPPVLPGDVDCEGPWDTPTASGARGGTGACAARGEGGPAPRQRGHHEFVSSSLDDAHFG